MKQRAPSRRLAKLAAIIHGWLSTSQRPTSRWILPRQRWEQVSSDLHRFHLAQSRGWTAAQASLLADVRYSLVRLRDEVTGLFALLPDEPQALVAASAHEIYRDLVALQDEFDDVSWCKERR